MNNHNYISGASKSIVELEIVPENDKGKHSDIMTVSKSSLKSEKEGDGTVIEKDIKGVHHMTGSSNFQSYNQNESMVGERAFMNERINLDGLALVPSTGSLNLFGNAFN
jgi:hypothetical protein